MESLCERLLHRRADLSQTIVRMRLTIDLLGFQISRGKPEVQTTEDPCLARPKPKTLC